MDEDIPPANDSLSYADDVPYETQLPDLMEQETAASLKKRIGNRIYLLEDSLSKKRKLADVEDDAEEEVVEEDAGFSYRPNAILLQGPPITYIPTNRVFAYATHFDAHPIGLEWVNDQTCVLVFTSRKSALQAWNALCRTPQSVNAVLDDLESVSPIEVDVTNEIARPAQPLPLALYPMEDRINTVLGNERSTALKETIHMRWARTTDVKEHGARLKSEFYKRHGDTAGKEGLPEFRALKIQDEGFKGNKRRKRNDDATRRQLDAELDVFLVEDESASSNSLAISPSGMQTNRTRQPVDLLQVQEEKRRILDEELDSFLANESTTDMTFEPPDSNVESTTASQGPSLLERTARASPSRARSPLERNRHGQRLSRSSRRKGQDESGPKTYQTDANGRWLHNAEVFNRRKRRNDYNDEGGFGMRAWSDERPRQPRNRKTQAELDRELDQM